MERLLLTLPCERGELYYITEGRRLLLARCTPKIEVYEHITSVPVLGHSCGVKTYHAALVICTEPEQTRPVDADLLQRAEAFDLAADIQRKDGIFEAFQFYGLQPEEIQQGGPWIFNLQARQEFIRKLLAL